MNQNIYLLISIIAGSVLVCVNQILCTSGGGISKRISHAVLVRTLEQGG
jgi:hypothetical protein